MKSSDFMRLFHSFLIVFCTANIYILLSGSICLWFASQERLSPEQTRMFETCNATWQKGTNTIFQLLDNASFKDLLESQLTPQSSQEPDSN